jgi:hypothetical protein
MVAFSFSPDIKIRFHVRPLQSSIGHESGRVASRPPAVELDAWLAFRQFLHQQFAP